MGERFPFPAYPNGWFRACHAGELAPGEVKRLHLLGRELVAFRSDAGAARVFDAHCPHLGAHLGVGGKVEGDGIRCPFHGWLWSGEGRCVEIPYAKKIPPKARIRSWPVVERNGVVFLHHDAEGRPPAYEVPEFPECGSPDWTPLEVRRWTVKSRWLDMNENSVDRAHFRFVHGTPYVPEAELEIEGHVFRVRNAVKMNTPRGVIEGTLTTTDYGPALQTVHITGAVDTFMLNTVTPIDDETSDVSFAYAVRQPPGGERQGVGAARIRDLEFQFEQDRAIWENKAYWERPMLCDGDGNLGAYRRWMRQFFSESSR
jgi:phenylpropionate dioxygenase-like ring-hydroxylating dioxygenase large terminal subunit